MKQKKSLIAGLYLVFSYWIRARQKEYWINIKGCYLHATTGELTVKYQVAHTRVVSEASLNSFLHSEYAHYAHPQQLYHLGLAAREVIHQQVSIKQGSNVSLTRRILRRVFLYE